MRRQWSRRSSATWRRAEPARPGLAGRILTAAALLAPLLLSAPAAAQCLPDIAAAGVDRGAAPAAPAAARELRLYTPIGTPVPGVAVATPAATRFEPAVPLAACTVYTLRWRDAPPRRFVTACDDWSAPTQLDDRRSARQPERTAGGARVAAAADGVAVAVWVQGDGRRDRLMVSRLRPATGVWEPPRAIDLDTGGSADEPALAAAADGTVTAAWTQARDGRAGVYARRLDDPPGAVHRLDAPAVRGDAGAVRLAVAADGSALAVWPQRTNGVTAIWAARRGARGWRPARRLDPGPAYAPAVAATGDGMFVAAWEHGRGNGARVTVARWGGAWSAPRALAAAPSGAPTLAAGADGTVALAWVQGAGASRRVALRRLDAATLRAGPVQPQPGAGVGLAPALAFDAAGNLTLAWEQADASGREGVLARRFDAGGAGAAPPARLDDPRERSAGSPVLAVDAAGNVHAAWYQDGPAGLQVWAARFDAGAGAWAPPKRLSDPRASVAASWPALAVDAAGGVTAVWQQFNGWRDVVMAARMP